MITMYKADLVNYSIKEVQVSYFNDTKITLTTTSYQHSEPRFSLISAFFEHEHQAVECVIEAAKDNKKQNLEKIKDLHESIKFIDEQVTKLKEQYAIHNQDVDGTI